MRLAKTACEVALRKQANQVDLATAQDAVREVRRTYSIEDYHFPELAAVHSTGGLTSKTYDSPREGKIVICDKLLHYKLVLGYEDPKKGRWFDVNPIVIEDLDRWQATQD
ncbi:hypothetical protein [Nodosilinea sp. LEGE 07088]|uniref:hypothetical protein n=1 Tax=Nodosilinea sp. LEGE 07088 TaxID=2777968 RepID=UPI001D132D75|nr:hypothetical protein [Nodosilinea sp. LEGE 07088]